MPDGPSVRFCTWLTWFRRESSIARVLGVAVVSSPNQSTINSLLRVDPMRAFVLSCALVLGGAQGFVIPAAKAHSGHGDEFVQNGAVNQVKASPEQDQLLGISTAAPQSGPDGQLTVPTVAIVDAAGKPLVFVNSGSTYDPVFVRLGPAIGDRTVVIEGVSANEQVVVSGALSLYAESQKNVRLTAIEPKTSLDQSEQTQPTDESPASPPWLVSGLIGVAVFLLALAIFGLRGRGPGSKQG